MLSLELAIVTEGVIKSIQPGYYGEAIQRLKSVFPDNLILAALDLVDRDSVIKYTTSWGRTYYEVLGSTATYSVSPHLSPAPSMVPTISSYCTCPAFAYAVLISETHTVCKHLLATRLAEQLGRCLARPLGRDDLAAMVQRQNHNHI